MNNWYLAMNGFAAAASHNMHHPAAMNHQNFFHHLSNLSFMNHLNFKPNENNQMKISDKV
jgi:hypothetical protein